MEEKEMEREGSQARPLPGRGTEELEPQSWGWWQVSR